MKNKANANDIELQFSSNSRNSNETI